MSDLQLAPSNNEWDAKRISGLLIGLILLGSLAYGFTIYVLPFLLTMVWGVLELALAATLLVFVLAIITNKKFWRAMRYSSELISVLLLGWVIEMNPWNILQLKIDEAKKDRENLREQAIKLKSQEDSLSDQLEENESEMRLAAQSLKIVKSKLERNPDNLDDQENYELKANDYNNAKNFIDGIKPIYNDITALVQFADKAYRKSGIALTNAENTLKKQRALYDAVSTGSAAMKSAMRAFSGDAGLNSDADKALDILKKDISAKVGSIKSSIQITSQIMNKKDLEDAAKVQMAATLAMKFDDSAFDYGKTVETSRIKATPDQISSANKYLNIKPKGNS